MVLVSGCGNPAATDTTATNTTAKTQVSGGDATPEQVEGVTAKEVLQRLANAYQETDAYFDNAIYRERFVRRIDGVPREPLPHQISVVFTRPNKLRLTHRVPVAEGDDSVVTVLSDGFRMVATSNAEAAPLLDQPAPETLSREALVSAEGLASALFFVPLEYLFPQLDLLLASDSGGSRLFDPDSAKLLASKQLEGSECYRVRLDRDAGAYVAWIDKAEFLLRRLDVPTEQVRKELDPDGDLIRHELWIDFADASLDTMIGAATFRIDTPESAGADAASNSAEPEATNPETSDQPQDNATGADESADEGRPS